MSVTIKTVEMQYRGTDGQYHGINAVAEKRISDQIAEIDVALAAKESEINTFVSNTEDHIDTVLEDGQTALDGIDEQVSNMISAIAAVAGNGTDTTMTRPDVAADAAAAGKIVKVSTEEPTEAANRLWIGDGQEDEYSIPTMADHNLLKDATIPFPVYPNSKYGTDGQLLRTNGNGETEWVNFGLPTDEQTADAVSDWLDDHPEATTTVQDGSLEEIKFSSDLKLKAIKDYITPQMFGAAGDGDTDDTFAIQTALDNLSDAGILYFPRGTYKITNTLYLKYGYRIITGCGDGSEIVKYFDGNMIENYIGVKASGITISNLNLNGNDRLGGGIYTYKDEGSNTRCGSIHLENVTVTHNQGAGLDLNDNYIAHITNSKIYYNGIGIHIGTGNGDTVDNCSIYDNNYGIIIDAATFNAIITECTIQSSDTCAILLGTCYSCTISNNYFEYNNGPDVIKLTVRSNIDGDSPTLPLIYGNYIKCTNNTKPINADYSRRANMYGNYFSGGAQTAGIYLGEHANTNKIGFSWISSAMENTVSDLGSYNSWNNILHKTVTAEPVNGIVDSGINYNDYMIIGAYSTNRTGWWITPLANCRNETATTWKLRIGDPTSTPTGSFKIYIMAIKKNTIV